MVLSARQDVYALVTDRIIAAIEDGQGAGAMPWHSGIVPMAAPRNACTEMPYRGINVVSLWAQTTARYYPAPYWASYEQWRKLGAQVRKGERGTPIVFFKKLDQPEMADTGGEEDAPRFALKHSHVFNFAQVEGWELPEVRQPSQVEVNQQVTAFVEATKAEIREGGHIPYYERSADRICMPPAAFFIGTATSSATEVYHAVLLHELTHWSGAPHRLDRVKGKRYGDLDYAFEELVAELGAAFLCSALRVVNEPRLDHATYIAGWLKILNGDSRAIFKAASLAQQAVEYLHELAADESAAKNPT